MSGRIPMGTDVASYGTEFAFQSLPFALGIPEARSVGFSGTKRSGKRVVSSDPSSLCQQLTATEIIGLPGR
ncbi:hypothetical protein RRG08_001660 [Elysia crispata]|uniref:Uncharacterized protein n=1 Tax=Elysia crispata TaxID=231223 RepID=A0AAE1E0P5_9GAST|nr:hypothetical protein RRG08_001660 [Elysia crispata]